jgi:predicted dehydrogenase
MHDDFDETRRRLLLSGSLGLASTFYAGGGSAATPSGSTTVVDEGTVIGGKVTFPPIDAASETPGNPPPNPDPAGQRVGFAVVGLGRLALQNILPAFAQSKHARLAGLVSGDPAKMRIIAAQYGVPRDACYGYEEMARLGGNAAIQVVYVVLPNALHRHAVIQAAQAGKHVLCEKPMATSADEARDMIAACRGADRKLMIAYRCQYEVNNRELAKRARSGELGTIQFVDAINTQNQGDPTQWRQIKRLSGGGSLPDVGLYCLNTTRALLGEEPIEVLARIHSPDQDDRFREVESTVSFVLRFPSGILANCVSSYSVHTQRNFRVLGSDASAEITNAFAYEGQKLHIKRRDGQAEANIQLSLAVRNQFSLEMDHMALCVRNNVEPRTPGEEGLQDQILMAAIYQSAQTGQPVALAPVLRQDAYRGSPLDKDFD